MSWFKKLQKTAQEAKERLGEVAERATDAADRATDYLADRGPGAVGEAAGEFRAERQYHRARERADEGWTPETVREITEMLEPVAGVDSTYAIPVRLLLAEAHDIAGNLAAAQTHYERALALLHDPAERQASRTVMVEELGHGPDALQVDTQIALADLCIRRDDPDAAIGYCMQAIASDNHAMTAYYLKGLAMLRKGLPPEAAAEAYMQAMVMGADTDMVLAWVDETMPDQRPWFEGRIR